MTQATPAPPDQPAAGRASRLPVQPTPFVGRDEETKEIRRLLDSNAVRLVTLTGPGGIGKSRLAFEVAASVGDLFAGGVTFAPLSSLTDPDLVAPAIARSLDVKESAERTILQNLIEFLRDKELMLLLDNFEHVVAAGPVLSQLLAACPRLKILVTSRAVLYLRGEHEYIVSPLPTPAEGSLRAADISMFDSIRLFVERARATNPEFSLADDNAATVAEICTRLDGLPLAIELAAAHTRELALDQMRDRLGNRLDLLTGGAADRPKRHQTLRATLDWDYELLAESEREIFRRLAVFAGGFTIEAAEAVINIPNYPTSYIVDAIESLVAKSLLRSQAGDDETRFAMLRTLREYGFEKLDASGETPLVKDNHAAFFLALAEEAAPQLRESEQVRWLAILDREHDNMRSGLRWIASTGDSEAELRLAAALAGFWEFRAHLSEGQRWLEEALTRSDGTPSAVRAKCLESAGILARGQGEYKRATTLIEQSIAVNQQIGNTTQLAEAIKSLGNVVSERGDRARARALYEESRDLKQKIGDERGVAEANNNLGVITRLDGDLDAAVVYYDKALAYFGNQGDKKAMARILMNLGEAKLEQGDLGSAKGFIRGSLVLCREIRSHWDIADLLELMASVSNGFGRARDASRLFGAASALRDLLGTPLPPSEMEPYERRLEQVKQGLGEARFAEAFQEGRQMDLSEAVAQALS